MSYHISILFLTVSCNLYICGWVLQKESVSEMYKHISHINKRVLYFTETCICLVGWCLKYILYKAGIQYTLSLYALPA